MAQREWVADGDGRQVYRVVQVEPDENSAERGARALAQILADRDQHPAGPELTDSTPVTATTITVTGDEVPAPDDDTPNGRLRRFIYLRAREKALAAETAAVKEEYQRLNARILDDWADDGVSRVTVDGTTAYMYPVSYVKKLGDATPADIRDALTRSGLGYMVEPTYSGSALRALLKEWRDAKTPLPTPLAEVVELVTNHEVRLRSATASTRGPQD